MHGLYESRNYSWCDEDLLGEGAAGKVYKAIHKVQTFKSLSRITKLTWC